MTAPMTAERAQITKRALLICDPAGNVQAVTSTAASEPFLGVGAVGKHFTQIFGLGSPITRWLAVRMQEAREQDEYSAEGSLESEGAHVIASLESLKHDGELYGFALRFIPLLPPGVSYVVNDGDSIVTRRQWHGIKNHVGAIKLYATFLKRKMPDGDERRIVEKIFNGVNALIDYLDKIRRGEPQ